MYSRAIVSVFYADLEPASVRIAKREPGSIENASGAPTGLGVLKRYLWKVRFFLYWEPLGATTPLLWTLSLLCSSDAG